MRRVRVIDRKDMAGSRFGRLVVNEYSHSKNGAYWRCHCDCGTVRVISGVELRRRDASGLQCSKWCGIAQSEKQDRQKRASRLYRERNRDIIKERKRRYYAENRDAIRIYKKEAQKRDRVASNERSRKWRERNRQRRREVALNWAKRNPAYLAYSAQLRRARKLSAMPSWVSEVELKSVFAEARRMNLSVDHIVPLAHPRVCGLHVPCNLQLMPRLENLAKNNSFVPEITSF